MPSKESEQCSSLGRSFASKIATDLTSPARKSYRHEDGRKSTKRLQQVIASTFIESQRLYSPVVLTNGEHCWRFFLGEETRVDSRTMRTMEQSGGPHGYRGGKRAWLPLGESPSTRSSHADVGWLLPADQSGNGISSSTPERVPITCQHNALKCAFSCQHECE